MKTASEFVEQLIDFASQNGYVIRTKGKLIFFVDSYGIERLKISFGHDYYLSESKMTDYLLKIKPLK